MTAVWPHNADTGCVMQTGGHGVHGCRAAARLYLLAVVVSGCSSSGSVLFDATPSDQPFAYTLNASRVGPVQDIAPTTFIDGIASVLVSMDYADESAALGTTHVIELRYADLVVASKTVTIELGGCLGSVGHASRYSQSICTYDSGDLRFAGDEAVGYEGRGCIGDGFCLPQCNGCSAGQRCTSRVVSTNPLASHLACAPIGSKQLGDTCTLIPDADGAYDDCGVGLLCMNAVCRATCDGPPDACSACANVTGYAAEVFVCP